MAHVLVMPQQGNTVESCLVVAWRAAEGQPVRAGDVVCEVETDKATFEVSAGADGVLLKILRQAGDDVPVMAPIAVIGARGEDWTSAVPGSDRPVTGPAVAREGGPAPAASAMPSPDEVRGRGGPGARAMRAPSPRARRLAAEKGISVAALVGTGPGGRVIERDVVAAQEARAAPVARRVLAVDGSTPAAARGVPAGEGARAEAPIRGIRKLIAERTRASLSTTAQLTFNGSAPAARIVALRGRLKASEPSLGLSSITIGDLVLYAACRVVPRFPTLNAHLVDGVLRTFERVHLGLAVDTPRGLMVPVIRNADQLSLVQLSAEAKRLASACLNGTVRPDELAGATFTVTNLGSFGVESFTPVLNTPQVGILGVCAIIPRVAAGSGGAPAVEQRMGLSLTVDHQIIDGAPASRILKAFADAIADVDLLLVK